MFKKLCFFLCINFHSISKNMINFDSVCLRSDDPVEDDKEKKELGCLTIENGIAPNHGLAFFVCILLFFWFCCSGYINYK